VIKSPFLHLLILHKCRFIYSISVRRTSDAKRGRGHRDRDQASAGRAHPASGHPRPESHRLSQRGDQRPGPLRTLRRERPPRRPHSSGPTDPGDGWNRHDPFRPQAGHQPPLAGFRGYEGTPRPDEIAASPLPWLTGLSGSGKSTIANSSKSASLPKGVTPTYWMGTTSAMASTGTLGSPRPTGWKTSGGQRKWPASRWTPASS